MDAILDLRRLTKHFAAHRAVEGISLQVQRGAFFSLLGPSGCGKTTTLRLIAGLEPPTAGEIWLDGERIDALPPYRRNVNTVFQSYALFPHLTVRRNVEFGLRCDAAQAAERVARVLDQVQLQGKEDRKPSELSGGEQQRAALARALILEPGVLLLDEPLSALDPLLRKQVRIELKDLQRRTGVTFFFVTHDQEEALALSDQMAVMNAGSIEQSGSPQELYRCPKTRFVASFLGAMNWIGDAGVRPESLRISPGDLPSGDRSRRASIVQTSFLGAVSHVEARLESGESILAQTTGHELFPPGASVRVFWNASDELRFPA